MTTQPEALRLANRLENGGEPDLPLLRAQAAAELRRLHEVNQELLKVAKRVAGWSCGTDDECSECLSCKARAAIAKATGGAA